MITHDVTLELPVGNAVIEVDATLELDLSGDRHELVAVLFENEHIAEDAAYGLGLGARLMWRTAVAWCDAAHGRTVIDELRAELRRDAQDRAASRRFDLNRELDEAFA